MHQTGQLWAPWPLLSAKQGGASTHPPLSLPHDGPVAQATLPGPRAAPVGAGVVRQLQQTVRTAFARKLVRDGHVLAEDRLVEV